MKVKVTGQLLLFALCVALCLSSAVGGVSARPKQVPAEEKTKAVQSDPAVGVARARIARVLRLLRESTPAHRNTVRVLFYGQSITQQEWSQAIADDLRRWYPNADLVIENRAIGGFASNLLIRTAEADLYPFYPDLVIFHDYGGEPDYEAIVRRLRSRTTAEVLLMSDHLAVPQQSDPHAAAWHDQHSNVWLPEIARRYGCGWVDVRESWRKHVTENHREVADLLRDGVHLNAGGNELMAAILRPYLAPDPAPPLPYPKEAAAVRTLLVGRDLYWEKGVLTVPFDGNRVDLLPALDSPSAASAAVFIDQKRPSDVPELYANTRTSTTVDSIWPAIRAVGAEKPQVAEEWTLRIADVQTPPVGAPPEARQTWTFTVTGSVTGPDGEGKSSERFVSRSGRVVILPSDWHIEDSRRFSGKNMADGFTIHWQTRLMGTDEYTPPASLDPAKDNAVTVAQGLKNGHHVLVLRSADPKRVPALRAVRVYCPPVPAGEDESAPKK